MGISGALIDSTSFSRKPRIPKAAACDTATFGGSTKPRYRRIQMGGGGNVMIGVVTSIGMGSIHRGYDSDGKNQIIMAVSQRLSVPFKDNPTQDGTKGIRDDLKPS